MSDSESGRQVSDKVAVEPSLHRVMGPGLLLLFIVALVTAFSYLELVTKYPKAAGAALYTHKAFGIHFLTFIVAFAVMCSGITSASTASRAFAANFSSSLGLGLTGIGITITGLVFMGLIAAVNFRGVS